MAGVSRCIPILPIIYSFFHLSVEIGVQLPYVYYSC